jgi:antitoxin component YwqK of YwqJK toxin-antitoxin module
MTQNMNSSNAKWDGEAWVQTINGVVHRVKPKGDGVHRRWHENGVLASEHTRVKGAIEGVSREWHDNGVLAKEVPHVSGRVHGTVRQWNRDGRLLGEYLMSEGRGVERVWNQDGSLQLEHEQVSDTAVRGKVWDDLGNAREAFLWKGKPISKARWLKKLERDGVSGTAVQQDASTENGSD